MIVNMPEHPVRCDKITRLYVSAHNICLHPRKAAHAVRNKPCVIQRQMRVDRPCVRAPGEMHLAPRRVGLVPEYCAPRPVQPFHRPVLVLQKPAERNRIAFGIENVILTVKLIVDLPADNRRMFAVAGRGFLHDPPHIFPVNLRIVIIMPARTVTDQRPVNRRMQNLRILLRQPGRRRRRRRRKDNADSHSLRQVQKTVKKAEFKFPLPRLDFTPRKFRHAHNFNPAPLHFREIALPHRLVPMLRVIAGSERQICSVQ